MGQNSHPRSTCILGVGSEALVNWRSWLPTSPLSSQRFPAIAVAQKAKKGGDLGTQKTLSNETEKELVLSGNAACSEGRVPSAQSRLKSCLLSQVLLPTMGGV